MPDKLTIVQGKTFTDTIRWGSSPFVFKPISGISLASGAPRLLVSGHGIADKWPVAVTRVVGMSQINAGSTPPADRDYVEATKIDVSTLELNEVSPVENGREWPAYDSGGFIQYYTPVDMTSMVFRFVFRKSFASRLNLKCVTGGTSGASIPTAAGTDGSVVWEETTESATKPWEAGVVFATNDVVDAKAVLWLSSESGEVVADNANKKIVTTVLPTVTAKLAKQNLVYEVEAEDLSGAIRLVDSGTAVVELEGTP